MSEQKPLNTAILNGEETDTDKNLGEQGAE
jgi:hypothetical protein